LDFIKLFIHDTKICTFYVHTYSFRCFSVTHAICRQLYAKIWNLQCNRLHCNSHYITACWQLMWTLRVSRTVLNIIFVKYFKKCRISQIFKKDFTFHKYLKIYHILQILKNISYFTSI
jgi:hypothetical protein